VNRLGVTATATVAAFLFLCAGAFAQTAPLDLPGAMRYALDHNATILSQRATLENTESQFAIAHSNEFPPITGTLQNQVEKSSNVGGTFQEFGLSQQSIFSQNTAQIGTTWTAYNGSLNQLQAQEAKRQVESSRGNYKRAQQQLAQDVTNAYYTVTARRETVRFDAADQAYQQALLDVARANERVGRAAGVDVLRAQVTELRAQSTLLSAQSDEATAREALASTIGAPPDTRFAYETAIPEPPMPATALETLVTIAKTNRPDVASARAQVAVARLIDGQIDTDRRPVIQVNGSFGNQTSPTTFIQEQQQRDADNLQLAQLGQPLLPPNIVRGTPGFWQIGATSTFNLSLIDYGARKARHRAARAGIDSAVAALQTTEYAVETDIRQALRAVQTTYANLQTAKQAVALGIESARIAQLQYKNGLISLTDATQAEQTSLSAQNDLATAQIGYVNAIVHLRVALGTTDPVTAVDMRKP
jgi:outer membrane protein